MSELLPFTCHKCGVRFATTDGGFCQHDKQPYCWDHLFEVQVDKTAVLLCEEHKGERKGTRRTVEALPARDRRGHAVPVYCRAPVKFELPRAATFQGTSAKKSPASLLR